MYKLSTLLIAAMLGAAGLMTTESALAFGHGYRGYPGSHVRFGVYVGAPLVVGGYWGSPYYASPYYYSPAYYPPTVVTVPVSPPTYVEQPTAVAPAQAAPQPGYWYYCAESRSYYPYVNQCPGGWQRVSPQPPG